MIICHTLFTIGKSQRPNPQLPRMAICLAPFCSIAHQIIIAERVAHFSDYSSAVVILPPFCSWKKRVNRLCSALHCVTKASAPRSTGYQISLLGSFLRQITTTDVLTASSSYLFRVIGKVHMTMAGSQFMNIAHSLASS